MFRRLFFVSLIFLLILSSSASFVSGLELIISGNGDGSENSINVDLDQEKNIAQSNESEVDNEIQIESDTGNNNIENSSGESEIITGNSEINVQIINQVNQNINNSQCCENSDESNIVVSNNLSNSVNSADINIKSEEDIVLNQMVEIANTVSIKADTGSNAVVNNTGDAMINTGNINSKSEVKNSDINTSFYNKKSQDKINNLTIEINGNASESINNISVVQDIKNDFVNNSFANISNNFEFIFETGQNSILDNIGNSYIKTGNIDSETFLINGNTMIGGYVFSCCDLNESVYEDFEDSVDDPDISEIDLDDPGDLGEDSNLQTPSIDSGKKGSLLAEAASVSRDLGVLGLSNTSSGKNMYLFLFALLFASSGLYFLNQTYFLYATKKIL